MTALQGLATRLGLARLLLITDLRSEEGDFAEFLDAAFAGGVDLVQLRDPAAGEDELLAGLKLTQAVGDRYQGLLSVYESGPLAKRFEADVLHLPERGATSRARGYLHRWALVGRSCHSPEQVDAAVADTDVNYFTVGPAFPRPAAAPGGVTGLDLIRYAAQVAPPSGEGVKPWFAVSGITLGNLDDVLAAGARRVAVSRAITDAADPEAAAMMFKDRLRRSWNTDPLMQQYTIGAFRR